MNTLSANTITSDITISGNATGGAETHTLLETEMSSHTHTIDDFYRELRAHNASGSGNYHTVGSVLTQPNTTNATGGGLAHNNMQPYIVTTCGNGRPKNQTQLVKSQLKNKLSL
jgi:microcystin-dependent protein